MTDPESFLKIKQGVLQFVVLKPIMGISIMILKSFGVYDEGYIAWSSSYFWLLLLYNASVCTAMYCLVLFYMQCSKDLLPYRPMPKFICVKSIIFLTFWYFVLIRQGIFVAFLTWAGIITDGAYSKNNIAQALQDALLCLEMPLFAWMHWYAFPWTDYEDSRLSSRLKFTYAIRDCLGIQDIIYDTQTTFSNLLQPWMGNNHIRLEDDEIEPLNSRRFGRYMIDEIPLNFELDPAEEEDYHASRNLVYGDFHFPVIHDGYLHPPVVQTVINKNATDFYDKLNMSRDVLPLDEEPGPPLIWDVNENE